MGFRLPKIAEQCTVPDREVLIDADVVAYYSSAGCDEMPMNSATRKADLRMKQIIDETRADSYTGYLTGKNNYRDLIATLQRYKGNRYDKDGKRILKQPFWLQMVRLHLQIKWDCLVSEGQEADDALSIHQCTVKHETIISSIDKDLMIVPGLHHDMNSGEITETTGYGDIWMEKGSCKGTGYKFFLTQLLMGDSTDWIKGLPKVTPMMKEVYGITRLGGCGPKAAFTIINPTTSYAEGLKRVQTCYNDYWNTHSYKHWRSGKMYKAGYSTGQKQLTEQGQLLWMRQKKDELWKTTMKL